MSYCRFENTARDLADCVESIECQEIYDLSAREKSALRYLLELSRQVTEYEDRIIDACTS